MTCYLICALLGLCLGHFLGRHSGWKEGLEEGRALAPLELRIEALNNGVCPLCQTTFTDETNCEEIDTLPSTLSSEQEIPDRVTK